MITRPRRSVIARAPAKVTVASRTGRNVSPTRRTATNLKGVTALVSALAGWTERWMRLLAGAAAVPSERAAAPGNVHTTSAQIARQRVPRGSLRSVGPAACGGDPAVFMSSAQSGFGADPF